MIICALASCVWGTCFFRRRMCFEGIAQSGSSADTEYSHGPCVNTESECSSVGRMKGESGWCVCLGWRAGQCYNCCTGVSQLTINCRFHRTATLSSDTWRHVTRDTAAIVTCPALSDPCHTRLPTHCPDKTIYPLSGWWMCEAHRSYPDIQSSLCSCLQFYIHYGFSCAIHYVLLLLHLHKFDLFLCNRKVRRYSEWSIILPLMQCWH